MRTHINISRMLQLIDMRIKDLSYELKNISINEKNSHKKHIEFKQINARTRELKSIRLFLVAEQNKQPQIKEATDNGNSNNN